jgi:hypothetical protein
MEIRKTNVFLYCALQKIWPKQQKLAHGLLARTRPCPGPGLEKFRAHLGCVVARSMTSVRFDLTAMQDS